MNTSLVNLQHDRLLNGFLRRKHRLFINGEWLDAAGCDTLDVENPSTGRGLASVAAGGAEDIDRAVKAAHRAFKGPWSQLKGAERTRKLLALADALEANADEFATLETLDGGNPIMHTRHGDIAMSIDILRANAGWTDKLYGEVPMTGSRETSLAYSIRQPIGVVGAITPWNAPFIISMFKIAPILATGCTMVHKPAELAPLSALRFAELVSEVGIPAGVFNVVTGYGPVAGKALVEHPLVSKIAFTGSTMTGRSILMGAASTFKRVTLELGGKGPVLIFPDADIDAAIKAISTGIFYKAGQFCAAGTRLFVHDKVYDRVVDGFESRAKALRVGQPLLAETEMGPIISRKQLNRVLGYIQAGISDGVEVVTGGKQIPGDGYFIQPTLLANTRPDMSVMRDEIFGPVLCISRFTDSDDLVALAEKANDTDYGLSARIWTRDLRNAHQLARKIDAGIISINGGELGDLSFGGFKSSGIGRELHRAGVESYTETKSVGINF